MNGLLNLIDKLEKYWKLILGVFFTVVFFIGAFLSFQDGKYFLAMGSLALAFLMFFITRYNKKN
jgi:uncharacterized protein involved in exopolysaccharide biosynthesis